MNTLSLPRSAADLLPHRTPMLLLDEVTDYSDGVVRAGVAIRADNAFVRAGGRLEPVTLIETLAQAAAALRGCEAEVTGDGAGKIGFLVGLKGLRISAPARVGDFFSIEVRRIAAFGQAYVMEGRVSRGDDCLAAGTLNVWEESESESLKGAGPARVSKRAADQVFAHIPNQECVSPMHRAVCACALSCNVNDEKNEAVGEFCFDESFAGFGGHFPGYAILPGIVMLKITLLLCECITGHDAELVGVARAKFAGQVRPGQRIRARVQVNSVKEGWRIAAVIVDSKTDALVLKLDSTARRAED